MDRAITGVVSGLWAWNILNIDGLGLFFKALPGKSLAEKTKKSKGGKKLKQSTTVMFIVASDGSFVLNQLSFGDQNYHVVLSLLKMHLDQCLCITFRTKKVGWIRTLRRVFCRDWTEEWIKKNEKLPCFGTMLDVILNCTGQFEKHQISASA